MKHRNLVTKSFGVLSALALSFAVTSQANAASGTDHGYYWGTYHEGGGSVSISFAGATTNAGNYKLTWTSGVTDAAGGKGWKPGSIRNVHYNCGVISGYHSFGVYGWTTSPLVEYYIDEMGSAGGTFIGTLSSDGGTYNVYKQQRVNAPSIQGTTTFWQYKNSRTSAAPTGSNRTVTMANHVNYWKSHIGSVGTFYDTVLNCEAFSGPGTCNATVW